MSSRTRGPIPLGVLFETRAAEGQPTRFHLSRPFDLAPDGGTAYGVDGLAELVMEAAGWLHAAGARPGSTVAIAKDNHWDYVLLASAAARLGAIPAMVSGALPPETLHTVLSRLQPAVLVATAGVLTRAAQGGADVTGIAGRTVLLDGPPVSGAIGVAELRGATAPAPTPRRRDEPMIVTHTSGTTGLPKLVVHSANTIMGHLGRTESLPWPIVGAKKRDTVATQIAYAHMRIITWTTGMLALRPRAAVLLADGDPATAARVLGEHRPTYLEALPGTYTRWEELTGGPDNPFTDVRLYVSTFDAMHPPTVRRFLHASRRPFPTWLQGWGQSETGPMAFRLLTRRALAEQGQRTPTTRVVGRPIPFFTGLKVVDPTTLAPVKAGRPGVALARTAGRCVTYVAEAERWQNKTDGAWWNTGDLATRSRTGAVALLDREVDAIPGLSCLELEDVLADRLAGLLEAVVIGVPGRRPLPVLATATGGLDRAAWARATADLPPLAEPVVLALDDLPRTGTGKVRRLELRDRLLGKDETYGSGRWT
jgi:acyl-coenzyme A synthetase/AMP-(fatty) acid ligase